MLANVHGVRFRASALWQLGPHVTSRARGVASAEAWRSRLTLAHGLTALVVATYVFVSMFTLARVPIVWLDEALYTQPAWSFVTSGSFGMTMLPDLHGFDQTNVAFGRIYLGAVAVSYKLLGLGPFQARLPSLVAGLLVIVLVYLLGRRLWNARVGVFAALALAVSPVFVMQTHDARPEMLLLAFILAASYLVVRAEAEPGIRGHLTAGLIAGLAADVHLNGVLVPFVLLAFIAVRMGLGRTLLRRGAAVLAGVAVGWTWWVSVHVLSNPSVFFDQWSTGQAGLAPFHLMATNPGVVLMAEPLRFLQATLHWWPLAWLMPLGAILGALILLRHHRDRNVLAVLGGIGAMVLLMALVVAHKAPTYAVLVWPFGALLVGRWLAAAVARPAPLAILIATSVASVAALSIVAASEWQGNYQGFVAQLRSHIPEGAVVQGSPTYWFGLADHPYIADQYFGPETPYEETVRSLGIQYIIADEYFLDTILKVQRMVSESDVLDFLAHHADLVAEIQDPQYGQAGWGQSTEFQSSVYQSVPHMTRIYRVRP
jgi:4-amino-4-deoxy-L-arabinose transferase-like glycosyltransferase